ncbi:MAG TPA: PPOX class F420-dependent oxidoreductase [Acidimicrobiia bacterium]|nr:PPOX class F420-dependent oxidoreductase [Acidimicrobiia bacterium]
MIIPAAVRALIEEGRLAHLVTIEPDGSPQVTGIWVGLEDNEIVSGHLRETQRKLANIRRDPRVALSIATGHPGPHGMEPSVVIPGRARVTAGGGADLLRQLAQVYLGPDVDFVPANAPDGFVTRIGAERIGGNGNWN